MQPPLFGVRDNFKADTTVILISHYATVISEVCSRAVWMNRGAILAEGAPDVVCKTYEESTKPAA